jgi:hypothetical protein
MKLQVPEISGLKKDTAIPWDDRRNFVQNVAVPFGHCPASAGPLSRFARRCPEPNAKWILVLDNVLDKVYASHHEIPKNAKWGWAIIVILEHSLIGEKRFFESYGITAKKGLISG